MYLVRSAGFRAEPILADRRYGSDTHSALLVWIDDVPHLVDPGYLIVDPLPLASNARRQVRTSFNQLVLTPGENDKLDLATIQSAGTAAANLRTAPHLFIA